MCIRDRDVVDVRVGVGRHDRCVFVLREQLQHFVVVDMQEADGDNVVITGEGPVSVIGNYQAEVNAYTKGTGRLALKMAGYRPCHNTEEEELDDNNFPVTTTLYGKHDTPRIKLTDVYLTDDGEYLLADGIDCLLYTSRCV